LRTLNRDGAGGVLGRLEAKLGPDLRGGRERKLIPDENEELFKDSPFHSPLYHKEMSCVGRPFPCVVGYVPEQ
jgi:hypothetical protein